MPSQRHPLDKRGTRAWRALVAQVVAEEPTCWLRLPGICTTWSQTADHVVTVKERPDLCMVRANLRGACRACNLSRNKKPVEQMRRRNVKRWAL
jgi:5-methylcytosine-specific restriction endonuclease McrA